MNKNKKELQRITIDIDTRAKRVLEKAYEQLNKNNCFNISQKRTKRGFHLICWKMGTWWEACCIRFMAGDDRKRLYLDLTNDKKPHNVLFDKKIRIKVKKK